MSEFWLICLFGIAIGVSLAGGAIYTRSLYEGRKRELEDELNMLRNMSKLIKGKEGE